MTNIDFNKPIKSQIGRIILVVFIIAFVVLLYLGFSTNRIKAVGPVKFNTSKPDSFTSPYKTNNNYGTEIKTENGDIINDHSTKNVYNGRNDTLIKKQK